MKIAVIGANGFVGSSLYKHLSKKYTTVPVTRTTVDILNLDNLKKYLSANTFDTIVICAATMQNNITDLHNNLGLMINFYHCRNLFGKLINTASGAEYDRMTDINLAPESDIFVKKPNDFYGLSQNLRSQLCFSTENFYNLRIFNCFGRNEISTRIFPRLLSSQYEFPINNDRYFDYFSIQDLCTVVDYFVCNTSAVKDINCVYTKKYLISEVANKFIDMHKLNFQIKIESKSNLNYTGDASKLNALGLNLNGLEHGLANYFN